MKGEELLAALGSILLALEFSEKNSCFDAHIFGFVKNNGLHVQSLRDCPQTVVSDFSKLRPVSGQIL